MDDGVVEPTPLERQLFARALWRLARTATSRARLRQLLLRHAKKLTASNGQAVDPDMPPSAWETAVEQVLDRCARAGLLDDARFAEGRARYLRSAGRSAARIRADLEGRGVAKDLARDAIVGLDSDAERADLSAAIVHARRRRLGPWRPAEERAAERQRDLRALQRAGFAFMVARRVIDAADLDELLGETEAEE